MAPDTTIVHTSWGPGELAIDRNGVASLGVDIQVTRDMYMRVRGTNIPAGTPNERDMYGNPLRDDMSDNIPCDDPACPPHIAGQLDADVEAWADIWFYANPIFIEVSDSSGWFKSDADNVTADLGMPTTK